MATQGIVSVVRSGKTVLKAVAGCNGMQGGALALTAESSEVPARQELYDMAVACGFGCPDCLVVQDESGSCGPEGFVAEGLWQDRFGDPRFNPRWESGTADFVHVIEMGGGAG